MIKGENGRCWVEPKENERRDIDPVCRLFREKITTDIPDYTKDKELSCIKCIYWGKYDY